MRYFLLVCIAAIFCYDTAGQNKQARRFTISGYVKESGSGESLIGVNIYPESRQVGTVTNNYGFYSITLPAADSTELIFSYVGFETRKEKLSLQRDLDLNIELEAGNILKEVTVSSDRVERQSESVKMSTVKLQSSQIRNVPSLLGEKDVLKVLQLMPGIQKGSEGSSGLYVRGGGPDQNLIILDDAIVYNASHLFGFFSLFNGDVIKSVELTKGGFPARFGGRLSSVLEMNMKEGNKEEWHGDGGIGLISSRFTIEGPLKKSKSSVLFSGRRTYVDLILRPILAIMDEQNTGYFFYDFNAKVNYDFGRKNKIYLSGYFGKDKFYLKDNTPYVKENVGFLWGNATGTFRWNHLYNSKLFSNTSFVFSNYSFGIYDRYRVEEEGKDYYAEYYSGIRDFTVKYDMDFLPNPKHWIKAGAVSILHRFSPHAFVEIDAQNQINRRDEVHIRGLESGIYAEDTWQPFEFIKTNGGIRWSHFIAGQRQYHFFEPRFSAAWRIKNDLALKGSYSAMNQYIHMISNTGINLPTDLWVPTTDRIKPQESRQFALGIVKDLSKPVLSLSLEGYYKSMNNVIGYKEGASFLQLNDPSSGAESTWEDNVTEGRAWSYGLEFLLQKNEGRISGWIGYTLSWTLMQFDSLNFGKKYYARYDRRHDISIIAIYKLKDNITLSGTWVYGTGNAVTLPLSRFQAPEHQMTGEFEYSPFVLQGMPGNGEFVNYFGEKNGFRMRAYHRFDIGIQFQKEKRWGERIWEISVYNLYSRMNPFFYYPENEVINHKEYGLLKQISLFPVIPSFTYSFRF